MRRRRIPSALVWLVLLGLVAGLWLWSPTEPPTDAPPAEHKHQAGHPPGCEGCLWELFSGPVGAEDAREAEQLIIERTERAKRRSRP